MRTFSDATGREWVATAREEETTRHHSRWFLAFHPAADAAVEYDMPEVRWQNSQTAERTILTMSELELQRRLKLARARSPHAEQYDP